jgi:hypothetical protein
MLGFTNESGHPLSKRQRIFFSSFGGRRYVYVFNQFTLSLGGYTQDREQSLGELTLAQIVDEITANRLKKS